METDALQRGAGTSARSRRVAELGHVGLRCWDVARQLDFYTRIIGLTVTDVDEDLGLYFLSARPAYEHHELLLTGGRDVAAGGQLIQQISFRCDSLDDVMSFLECFEQEGVPIDMVVSHGNAIGVYFFDPEANRGEVYWPTGMAAKQPYVWHLNLHRDSADVMSSVRDHLADYARVGFVEVDYADRTKRQDRASGS